MEKETGGLPVPGADALDQSNRLVEKIRNEIESNSGHISFRRYMEMALYEPGFGYYSAGSRKFGSEGDFITAPEVSPLFSYCLANQCMQVMDKLGQAVILELGAGTGRMACDLLSALEKSGCLPDKYLILETSADLKQRQMEYLSNQASGFTDRIEWLDRLPDKPVQGIILANEVVDAFPVHRVVDEDGLLSELNVSWGDGGFNWLARAAGSELVEYIQHIKNNLGLPWPGRFITEVNPALGPWVAALSGSLKQGLILLIDYGYSRNEYYHPQRNLGTLVCHYRHRVHTNPFIYPGLQDISTSVDFTAVAEAAVSVDLQVSGYTTQAFFLAANGLEEFLAQDPNENLHRSMEISSQVKRLILPDEMGEKFKVMGLSRAIDGRLAGFSMSDQRARL